MWWMGRTGMASATAAPACPHHRQVLRTLHLEGRHLPVHLPLAVSLCCTICNLAKIRSGNPCLGVRTANSLMERAFCAYDSGVAQYSQMVQGCVDPLLSTKPPARKVSRMTKDLQAATHGKSAAVQTHH